MIDAGWLDAQLRYDLPGGYRLDGCQVGGSAATLKVIDPHGEAWAIRIPRAPLEFPSYIHEVPNWVAPSPRYELPRLNRKLANLVGDPQPLLLVTAYRTLFGALADSFRTAGVADLDELRGETEDDTRALRFLLQTPPFAYRLQDLVSGAGEPEAGAWASQALAALERLGPGDPDLDPGSLLDNPLLVWGGAVMAGFFTRAELAGAATEVERHLDALPEARVQAFLEQALLLSQALAQVTDAGQGLRLLCDATGFYPWPLATDDERDAPDEFCTFMAMFDG
jgi:hypothetical protein